MTQQRTEGADLMSSTTPKNAVARIHALAERTYGATTAQRLIDELTLELGGRIVVHKHQDLKPRRFVLRRYEDVTGVSGEGRVADGVLWPDRTASIRWREEHPSIVFWDRGRVSVEFIHGHGGATEIEWLDDADGTAIPTQAQGAD
jgi:hypothetical protein